MSGAGEAAPGDSMVRTEGRRVCTRSMYGHLTVYLTGRP